MKGNIEERAAALAQYIIENKATVRAAAAKFGVSKSTVHTVPSIGVGCFGCLTLQLNMVKGLGNQVLFCAFLAENMKKISTITEMLQKEGFTCLAKITCYNVQHNSFGSKGLRYTVITSIVSISLQKQG